MSEQVTTREELDALPDRSVVLDSDGDAWAKEGDIWVLGINRWDAALLLGSAPLAVLHIPGQPHAPQRVQPSRASIARALHYQDCRCPRFDEPDHVDYVHMLTPSSPCSPFSPPSPRSESGLPTQIAATAKVIRDAHGGAPPDVVGHILAGYAQAEGVVRAAKGGAR